MHSIPIFLCSGPSYTTGLISIFQEENTHLQTAGKPTGLREKESSFVYLSEWVTWHQYFSLVMAQVHEGRWAFRLLVSWPRGQAANHLAVWGCSSVCSSVLPLPCGKRGGRGPRGRHEAASYKARRGNLVKCECAGLDPPAPEPAPCTCGKPCSGFGIFWWSNRNCSREKTYPCPGTVDGCDYVSCSIRLRIILLFQSVAIFTAQCEMLTSLTMVDKTSASIAHVVSECFWLYRLTHLARAVQGPQMASQSCELAVR